MFAWVIKPGSKDPYGERDTIEEAHQIEWIKAASIWAAEWRSMLVNLYLKIIFGWLLQTLDPQTLEKKLN